MGVTKGVHFEPQNCDRARGTALYYTMCETKLILGRQCWYCDDMGGKGSYIASLLWRFTRRNMCNGIDILDDVITTRKGPYIMDRNHRLTNDDRENEPRRVQAQAD